MVVVWHQSFEDDVVTILIFQRLCFNSSYIIQLFQPLCEC